MRTTKKILSAVLAVSLLASTSAISGFAATVDDTSTVSGDHAVDTAYSRAAQSLDDQYAYSGNDLGATYSPEATTFRVWSPTATNVKVNLYATGSDVEEGAADLGTYPLVFDEESGVWSVTVPGDLKNIYYTYSVTAVPVTGGDAVTKETQDVYSQATGVNGNRSMVVDLDSTDPEGWDNDTHVLLDEVTDSSVWELHVKDFSYDESSGVSEENRGKYLAFTETGTTLNGEGNVSTCIDYLKELGVTTVQLNPAYDFESVNEAGDNTSFNWGYDPQNYNVPEGSYSSNPYDGNVRINEFKQMVQALHNAGISVVMDVVYNHTFSTNSCFQKTVPNYYYRMNAAGAFSNGSGCGNETATERAMFRNYVIQSCLYWVNEYHIDGFRFDLMGIMDVETMNLVREALDEVDTRISMWGEGWQGGESYRPKTTCTGETFYPALQANASKLNSRIGIFNDGIRDGIKGGAMTISNSGFVQGAATSAKGIICGVRANVVSKNNWKASAPSQCVTYDSCHDNATLYDQLAASMGLTFGTRDSDLVAMNKLASAIVYTSQGIHFTLAGEEMCRTKDGDTNSYKSPATLNSIKWQNIVDYADVVSYYKGMNQINRVFEPFNCDTTKYSNNDYYVMNNAASAVTTKIAFTVANDTEGQWSKMAVLYNGSSSAADITLKDTSVTDWVVIANEQTAGLEKLGEVTGSTFTVAAHSAIIAVEKTSFEALNLSSNMGKVTVNYVHNSGKELDSSVVLQGSVGTGYQTTESATIPDTYILDRVEGNTVGTFSENDATVTYYYRDYIPESIENADINGDGVVNVDDVTLMQYYLADMAGLTEAQLGLFDVNYDGINSIDDITMLQMALSDISVSSGTVTVNYYYTAEDGSLNELTSSKTITGRAGSPYASDEYKVMGYAIDEDKRPNNASGIIPFGESTVNYYYTPSSLDITLHIKHSGSLTWTPSLWIWGSDTKGVDSNNLTSSGVWPGDMATAGENGWFDYNTKYVGFGTYNVIVSNNANPQSADYKGCIANEMWIVIDDALTTSTGSVVLNFYLDNPDDNPDARVATEVYKV